MTYASVADVEVRLNRTFGSGESDQCEALLVDATNMLDAMVDVDISDQTQRGLLKIVCANMVSRSLATATSESFGVGEATYTMGPFTQSLNFSNPSGDLYLTKGEKRMLGIGGSRGRVLMPAIGGDCHATHAVPCGAVLNMARPCQ